MTSNKGKGILLEEDDDAPILLPDQADEHLIKEYSLSLIGKILNPKKQNVERLIVAMPDQWGMSEKITACDLGNGCFLFNFDNEEDLNYVLNQGPFHHNFYMFVLVRWEPVVDESYPSLVPFWIQLQGIPLHLCTHQNLEAIGDRLGKVDKIDSAEGKIRVEIDSSKPLKFTRKLQTRKKEDINIKLHYEMLFKHCSTCGLMTHETQYCTMYQSSTQSQLTGRETVFDRVRPSTGGDVSSRVPSGSARVKDEIARPHKDGASSYARVHRSTHSSRSSRVTKPRDSRYNPYSYVRSNASSGKHQEAGKEQLWKEKQARPLKIHDQQPRDTASASAGNTKLRLPVTEEALQENVSLTRIINEEK